MVPRHVGASFFEKSLRKIWWKEKNAVSLHSLTRTRAFSSAGLEHLPYKQRVGGSNPSTPTSKQNAGQIVRHFSFIVIVAACLYFLRFAAVVACMACFRGSRNLMGVSVELCDSKEEKLFIRHPMSD